MIEHLMIDTSAILSGQCSPWPTQEALVSYLENGGLRVNQGLYSVRVEDCSHFVFQHLGGDITSPTIDADAENAAILHQEAQWVSAALTAAGVKHRFEVYDYNDKLVAYLHFNWPAEDEGQNCSTTTRCQADDVNAIF
jgi:hypothetical protein